MLPLTLHKLTGMSQSGFAVQTSKNAPHNHSTLQLYFLANALTWQHKYRICGLEL